MDLAEKWARIGLDRNYSALDLDGLNPDLQGWGSRPRLFDQVICEEKPQLVIEVGTWKGASLVHMAKLADRTDVKTQFICVDTWLGSNDTLWLNENFRKSLLLQGGYPTMYRQFIRNILDSGIAERVFPLPMTSTAAYHVLRRLRVRADVVYIDAGHEEEEVAIDLSLYYRLLKPNGVLFGDDYGPRWPGVVAAVNKFAAQTGVPVWTTPGKFMLRKQRRRPVAALDPAAHDQSSEDET